MKSTFGRLKTFIKSAQVVIFTSKCLFFLSLELCSIFMSFITHNMHLYLKIYPLFFVPLLKIWYIQTPSPSKVLVDLTFGLTVYLRIGTLANELTIRKGMEES